MPKSLPKASNSKARKQRVFGQGEAIIRAGLYARVSTHDQQTLPMQLSALRDYVKRRGWVVALEMKEIGSGASLRQKREELLAAARRREVDTIVVWRLDRWGRSLVDLVSTLQELVALKVGFVSLSEALDMTTASGRALAGMLAVFAEFERDILRDRVRAGIAQARKEGKRPVSSIGTENRNKPYTPSFSGATGPKSGRFAPDSTGTGRITGLIHTVIAC